MRILYLQDQVNLYKNFKFHINKCKMSDFLNDEAKMGAILLQQVGNDKGESWTLLQLYFERVINEKKGRQY